MFQTAVVEKTETHNICFGNYADCEIMRKNIVETERKPMKIWHMYIACWITKAEDTHSEYAISYFLFFHCNNCCTNVPQGYVIYIYIYIYILLSCH